MTYQPFPAFANWRTDFDSTVVDRYAQRLYDAKETSTPERLDVALTEAMRSAAVDTGAIEGLYATDRGFTRTVATQSAAWEMVADEKGAHVRRAIEDAIAGYELVLNAVTGSVMAVITEAWIRSLHEVMMASQGTYRVYVEALDGYQDHPLPRGRYKHQPNNPTTVSGRIHDYAPPSDTPAEMARLMNELRTPEFVAAHPVVQAAYAHYAFVCIHPFADGNGRVARALASVFLYRNPGVPLVVFADQRDRYIDVLEAADRRDHTPLVGFFAERVIDTVSLVVLSLSTPDKTDHAVSDLESAWSDIKNQDVSYMIAIRLRELCLSSLRTALKRHPFPPAFKVQADDTFYDTAEGKYPHPDGYPGPKHACWVNITGLADPTDTWGISAVRHSYAVFGPAKKDGVPEWIVLREDGTPGLEVWQREIFPVASTSLDLKLDQWATAAVSRFAAALRDRVVNREIP